MRLLIFGASGRTGRAVVRQALDRGHQVTAFVRRAAKLDATHQALRIVEGNVADSASVKDVVRNHDAIVSTLGVGQPLQHDQAVIDGIRHIVDAMGATGVRRLVYQSFIGVAESRPAVGFLMRYVAPIPLRHEIADHEIKEGIVRESATDWTIVRPPKLTDGPPTSSYRVGDGITTWSPMPSLSRADVAHFIVQELEQPAHIRRAARLLH